MEVNEPIFSHFKDPLGSTSIVPKSPTCDRLKFRFLYLVLFPLLAAILFGNNYMLDQNTIGTIQQGTEIMPESL